METKQETSKQSKDETGKKEISIRKQEKQVKKKVKNERINEKKKHG